MTLSRVTRYSAPLLGNTVLVASQWLILALLARENIAYVGLFSLGLAVASPAFTLTDLQLRNVLVTDTHSDFQDGVYWGMRIGSIAISVALVIVLIRLLGYGDLEALVVVFICIGKTAESAIQIILGHFQKHQMLVTLGSAIGFSGLFPLVGFVVLQIPSQRLELGLQGYAAGWLVSLVIVIFIWLLLSRRSPDSERPSGLDILMVGTGLREYWRLLVIASPLGIVAVSWALFQNVPRVLLERTDSLSALGSYTAVYFLLLACNILVASVVTALLPTFTAWVSQGQWLEIQTLLARLSAVAVVSAALLTAGGWIWGQSVLALLYSPLVAKDAQLLLWLAPAAGAMAIGGLYSAGLTALREFGKLASVAVVTLLVLVFASILLIPNLGADGAAIATCGALFLYAGATMRIAKVELGSRQ